MCFVPSLLIARVEQDEKILSGISDLTRNSGASAGRSLYFRKSLHSFNWSENCGAIPLLKLCGVEQFGQGNQYASSFTSGV